MRLNGNVPPFIRRTGLEGFANSGTVSNEEVSGAGRRGTAGLTGAVPGSSCAGCGASILDRYFLLAVDKPWHVGCLKCGECKGHLDSELTCYSRQGNIYCKEDYFRLFSKGEAASAASVGRERSDRGETGDENIGGGGDGKMEGSSGGDHHQGCGEAGGMIKRGRRCARCGSEIGMGELVMRARDLVFHWRCFTCHLCRRPLLTGDLFGLREDKVYCKAHYLRPCSEDTFSGLGTSNFIPGAINPNQPPIGGHPLHQPGVGVNTLQTLQQYHHHHHHHHQQGGHVDPHVQAHLLGEDIEEKPKGVDLTTTTTTNMNNDEEINPNGVEGSYVDMLQLTGTLAGNEPKKGRCKIHGGRTAPKPRKKTKKEFYCFAGTTPAESQDESGQGIGPMGELQSPATSSRDTPTLTSYQDGTPCSYGNGGRCKRMRTSFKHQQLRAMKEHFAANHNPDAKELKQLAQKTGLSKRVLQNARAKWRRSLLRQQSLGPEVVQESRPLSETAASRESFYSPEVEEEETPIVLEQNTVLRLQHELMQEHNMNENRAFHFIH